QGIGADGLVAYGPYLLRASVLVVTFQAFLHLMDVYDFRVNVTRWDFLKHLIKGVLLGGIVVFGLHLVVPSLQFGVVSIGTIMLRISAVVAIWHFLIRISFNRYGARAKVLIVGTGRLARALAIEIIRRPELGLSVTGFVDDREDLLG